MTRPTQKLADHVEQSVAAIAEVHHDHYRGTSPLQRATDRLTGLLGRPAVILALVMVVAAWIGANLWIASFHAQAPDPPPFVWLELFATVSALLLGVLILATQRRENVLAEQRSQLTLQLAMLSETKNAKIIVLLEELRRDTPSITDRVDAESDEMSNPADPRSVLAAIQDRAAEAES